MFLDSAAPCLEGRPVALVAVAAVVASGTAFAQQSDTPVVKPVGQIHDKLRMAKEREGAALAGTWLSHPTFSSICSRR